MVQAITPNLWFNGNAKQAVDFYTSAFPNSRVTDVSRYPESAGEGLADFQSELAGKELTVGFTLNGCEFMAINAGAEFDHNASESFMVNFHPRNTPQAKDDLDALWQQLSDGGTALMPLQEYPFSSHYGWVQDRYGVSWQLMLQTDADEQRPFVTPSLLFAGDMQNHAAAAMQFYLDTFKPSQAGIRSEYGQPTGPANAGSLQYADFTLLGNWFVVMDSGVTMNDRFSEAVSFSIACKDQAEIDYYWQQLSSVPEAEQCGWCKDKFGVSWQVVPANMGELMSREGAYAKMMNMKKLVIADF